MWHNTLLSLESFWWPSVYREAMHSQQGRLGSCLRTYPCACLIQSLCFRWKECIHNLHISNIFRSEPFISQILLYFNNWISLTYALCEYYTHRQTCSDTEERKWVPSRWLWSCCSILNCTIKAPSFMQNTLARIIISGGKSDGTKPLKYQQGGPSNIKDRVYWIVEGLLSEWWTMLVWKSKFLKKGLPKTEHANFPVGLPSSAWLSQKTSRRQVEGSGEMDALPCRSQIYYFYFSCWQQTGI